MKTIRILVINGPNLNLTGRREPQHYGSKNFDTLHQLIEPLKAAFPGLELNQIFSSDEGAIVDLIHQAATNHVDGMVINPGGFTHTSVAIGDAIRAAGIPVVEVHLSHVYAREEFRKHNLIAPACIGSISGLGIKGYQLAISYLLDTFQEITNQ